MSAFDRLRDKLYASLPDRAAAMRVALADVASGRAEGATALKELLHKTKGEAQLLSVEPLATVLERADRLVKGCLVRGDVGAFTDVLGTTVDAIDELSRTRAASVGTEFALAALEAAIEGDGP